MNQPFLEFVVRKKRYFAVTRLIRYFDRNNIGRGEGMNCAGLPVVLRGGGFNYGSEYFTVIFVDKIYFHFYDLAAGHAKGHCAVEEWF